MDITKLNDIVYDGAKPISNKIGISLKNPKRNTKPGCWE